MLRRSDHVAHDRHRVPHHLRNLVRQAAAVGVTQCDAVGTGARGSGDGGQCVLGVELVTIEEVLGVVCYLFAQRLEVGHAVGDHGQVIVK
ncbi:MAG: hypothetical protein H7Z42_04735 [Roseiflexaceae bacterium]|nr:hypothetical protein [Roseiflexaceae bacterium]